MNSTSDLISVHLLFHICICILFTRPAVFYVFAVGDRDKTENSIHVAFIDQTSDETDHWRSALSLPAGLV